MRFRRSGTAPAGSAGSRPTGCSVRRWSCVGTASGPSSRIFSSAAAGVALGCGIRSLDPTHRTLFTTLEQNYLRGDVTVGSADRVSRFGRRFRQPGISVGYGPVAASRPTGLSSARRTRFTAFDPRAVRYVGSRSTRFIEIVRIRPESSNVGSSIATTVPTGMLMCCSQAEVKRTARLAKKCPEGVAQ